MLKDMIFVISERQAWGNLTLDPQNLFPKFVSYAFPSKAPSKSHMKKSLSIWLQFTLIHSEVSRNEEEPAGYTSQNLYKERKKRFTEEPKKPDFIKKKRREML